MRDRRDDLAEMSEGVRRVYVARTARLIAGAAATVAGGVWLAAAASPSVEAAVASVLPGSEPSVLSSLLLIGWVVAGLGYLAGRSLAEERFARAMSACVLPGDDVHRDLDRLQHVRPDHVAARLAQRIESTSVTLPLIAAALLGPATAIYFAMWASELHYPNTSLFDETAASLASALLVITAAGLGVALVAQHGLRRWTTTRIGAVRRALIPIVWVSLGGCVAGAFVESLRWPSAGVGIAGAVLFAVLTFAQKDRRALGVSDSDAATDPSFRDMIRWLATGIRRGLAAVPRRVGRAFVAVAAVCGVAALGAVVTIAVWPSTDADLRLAVPESEPDPEPSVAAPNPPVIEPPALRGATRSAEHPEYLAPGRAAHSGSVVVDLPEGSDGEVVELFWIPGPREGTSMKAKLSVTLTELDSLSVKPRINARLADGGWLGLRWGGRGGWDACAHGAGPGAVKLVPKHGETLPAGRVRVSYEAVVVPAGGRCPR